MKRFLIDMIMVLLLVAIGSSIMNQPVISIEDELYEFEEQIKDDWFYEQGFDGYEVVGEKQSKAADLAQISGEIIHLGVEVVVKTIASLFSIFLD